MTVQCASVPEQIKPISLRLLQMTNKENKDHSGNCDGDFTSLSTTDSLCRRVARIRLQDIGISLRFTCRVCLESVQLGKLRAHHRLLHEDDEDRPLPILPNTSIIHRPAKERKRVRIPCRFCTKSFVIESHRRSHENSHHVEMEMRVTLSPASSQSQSPVSEFRAKIHHGQNQCRLSPDEVGSRINKTQTNTERRMTTSEWSKSCVIFKDEDDEVLHSCRTCWQEFPTSSFIKHLMSHCVLRRKEHRCNLCNFISSNYFGLRDHLATQHSGLLRYVCTHCKKRFGWYQSIRKHQRSCKQRNNNNLSSCKDPGKVEADCVPQAKNRFRTRFNQTQIV